MRKLIIFALIVWFMGAVVPPEKFLGFRPGADKKLADYGQIVSYLKTLETTGRLKLVKIGKTTLGKDMYVAIITSEKNMASLEEYKRLAREVYFGKDPSVVKRAKPVFLISCTIHSTEIGASQMSMELAYNLVAEKDPRARQILENVILLLVPSSNPDGVDMVVDWYRKTLGTEDEGKAMPWLYHHYAGHDDNRDWYMLNLQETRNLTRIFYREWFPVVILDEHQMGSTGARLFLPPFKEPPSFSVNPLIWRLINLMGTYMAYRVEDSGKTGVLSYELFTAWWIGALDDTAWFHNSIGLLSEMASSKLATPIYIEPTELSISWSDRAYGKRVTFPNPWKGGWWRLRDIVEYELELSLAGLHYVAQHPEEILATIFKINREEERLGRTQKPYAYRIPLQQEDPTRTAKMMERLIWGGVKVYRAKESGGGIQAGDFIIPLSQPYRPYILELFKRYRYPLEERPYDVTTTNLPGFMGVEYEAVKTPIKVALEEVKDPYPRGKVMGEGSYFCGSAEVNYAYRAMIKAARMGLEIYRNPSGGELCFKGPRKLAERLADENHITLKGREKLQGFVRVKFPRIAVYKQWGHVMTEGWLRYFLDEYGVPYRVIHNEDIKKGKLKDYDLIFFPSLNPKFIMGNVKPTGIYRWYLNLPKKYMGGIGKEGVKNLIKFVSSGGRIVLMGRAVGLAWEAFRLPVMDGLSRAKDFFCPHALVKIKVKNSLPLGLGFKEEVPAVFYQSVAMRTFPPLQPYIRRRVVAYFPRQNILLAGYLKGEKYLSRLAAVVDVKYRRGAFHLIGIDALYRAQAAGTFRFILNSILYPEVRW